MLIVMVAHCRERPLFLYSRFPEARKSQDVFLAWAVAKFMPGLTLPEMQPAPRRGQRRSQVSNHCILMARCSLLTAFKKHHASCSACHGLGCHVWLVLWATAATSRNDWIISPICLSAMVLISLSMARRQVTGARQGMKCVSAPSFLS